MIKSAIVIKLNSRRFVQLILLSRDRPVSVLRQTGKPVSLGRGYRVEVKFYNGRYGHLINITLTRNPVTTARLHDLNLVFIN